MKTAYLAGLSMLFVSGVALADDQLFTSLDTNRDGVIALEEAKVNQTMSAYFVLFDVDNSGTIDSNELAKVAGDNFSLSSGEQLTRL